MKLPIVNIKGKESGKDIELADGVFGVEPNDHAIYLDVKQYLAAQRQGTHKSKEKAEIVGSTRKLKKQKGTGTARAGSIKSPILRGGGRVFGPKPRDYDFKLNKKLKQLARKSALSYKVQGKDITILEDVELKEAKTKGFAEMLKALDVEGLKTLIVCSELNKNLYLSSRNIRKAQVISADSLNTYGVLNADKIILEESSVKKIEDLLS